MGLEKIFGTKPDDFWNVPNWMEKELRIKGVKLFSV